MFSVGQKVVCITDYAANAVLTAHAKEYGITMPVKGTVYTIREFDVFQSMRGLRLVEIRNRQLLTWEGMVEPGWCPDNFRPLTEQTTETGMAILRKALNDMPVELVADVFGEIMADSIIELIAKEQL